MLEARTDAHDVIILLDGVDPLHCPSGMFEFNDLELHLASRPEQVSLSARIVEEVRHTVLRELARQSIPGILVLAIATPMMGLITGHWQERLVEYAVVVLAMLTMVGMRVPCMQKFRRGQSGRGDERLFFAVVLISALIWGGYISYLVYLYPQNRASLLGVAFTAAIGGAVVVSFGMWLRLAQAYFVGLLVPMLVIGPLLGGSFGWGLFAGDVVFIGYLWVQSRNWNSFFWFSRINEAVLAERSHELIEARDAAEEASRAKSQFLARMSHELRTPMNAVLWFAQLIELSSASSKDTLQNSREIIQAGDHLMTMIDELLDISRIETGSMELRSEVIHLGDLTRGVVDILQGASREEVSIRLEIEEGMPLVRGDSMRLRQIIINLVSNAIKFTTVGTIVISLHRAGEEICLSVSDTGSGIPRELINMIFDPFVQGSPDGEFAGGIGLGLAITRQLVDLMGGRIEVTSTPGEGSCFDVRLPLVPADTAS